MHVAARRRLGRVQVAVRVDPDDAARPVRRRHADERPERDRVVAAEHERRRAGARVRAATSFATWSHSSRICGRKRARSSPDAVDSATGASTLPRSLGLDAERRREMLRQPGVADRRRPHVDAAPAGAEVERGADQGHVPLGRLHAHGSKANVRALADQPERAVAAPVRVLLADDDDVVPGVASPADRAPARADRRRHRRTTVSTRSSSPTSSTRTRS